MSAYDRFASQIADVPERLRSIFMPQLEQLGATPVPTRYGVLGRIERDEASGWFWGCAPAEDIAITIVRMQVRESYLLRERPEVRYSAIGLMCQASTRMMEQVWMQEREGADGVLRTLPPTAPALGDVEEVSAFWMNPCEYEFSMTGGTVHSGTSVHFLPEFFERMDGEAPGQLADMPRDIEAHPDLSGALELRSLLRQVTPRHANHPGAPVFYQGLALQVAGAFSAHCADAREHAGAGASELADRAKALMAESLARPLSLDELASALYVSRSRLCELFRRETGGSVGAFQTALRMRRAKELLRFSDASIADIARQVGYASQSSFAAAFKHACGITPRQWRRMPKES